MTLELYFGQKLNVIYFFPQLFWQLVPFKKLVDFYLRCLICWHMVYTAHHLFIRYKICCNLFILSFLLIIWP
jgi:hypothetical protein